MATDWSLDFCLVCDRQTLGGAYCSQSCRLAELDRSSASSEPSSPTTVPSNTCNPWNTHRNTNETGLGLHLGPPIDFAAYKMSLGSGSGSQQQSKPNYGINYPPQNSRSGLSPSSSHTSLCSLQSSAPSTTSSLSDRAQSELEDYAGCFDQVRDWKRRLTA